MQLSALFLLAWAPTLLAWADPEVNGTQPLFAFNRNFSAIKLNDSNTTPANLPHLPRSGTTRFGNGSNVAGNSTNRFFGGQEVYDNSRYFRTRAPKLFMDFVSNSTNLLFFNTTPATTTTTTSLKTPSDALTASAVNHNISSTTIVIEAKSDFKCICSGSMEIRLEMSLVLLALMMMI